VPISVSVVVLKDLFSDAFHFRLPYFQRAYAWQTEQVGRLLSDIRGAMQANGNGRGYFLGKVMVAKRPDRPDTALVDGHQRIMTLTLLFAVLRDLESDPKLHAQLDGFIRGHDVRLSPQDLLAQTVARFVQAPGGTSLEPDSEDDEMSETERNVIENRNYLRSELSSAEYTPQVRRALTEFLAEKCCVIVSAVEDEEEAWSYLRIEEDTRVGFREADRAKYSLLSIVPPKDRPASQKIWEQCEALLGADDLYALLGHLRTLKRRRNSGKPVESDIAESYTFNEPGCGLSFLETQLLPAAERLAGLRQPGDRRLESARHHAEHLSWIDPQLWVPAALLWLERAEKPAEQTAFFKRLERLVWMMKIAGYDPTRQYGRIVQLLGEIGRGLGVSRMSELEISPALREAALANLRSISFDAKHYSARVLRRISIALGEDPGPIDRSSLTIEHILPRSFAPKSGWKKHFPSRNAVKLYSHRLGNLTFLSPADNQKAATLDWAEKRPILAKSPLLLSRRVAEATDWTPDQILGRTDKLIRALFEAWDLKI